MSRRVFQYIFNYIEYTARRSGQLEGKLRNLGDKWSLPLFYMDQKCTIVEFYGDFLLNKNGYPTIIHFIFHLAAYLINKVEIVNESEIYIDFYNDGKKQ